MLLCYVIDSGLSTSLLLLATLIIVFYIYIYITPIQILSHSAYYRQGRESRTVSSPKIFTVLVLVLMTTVSVLVLPLVLYLETKTVQNTWRLRKPITQDSVSLPISCCGPILSLNSSSFIMITSVI